jgi:hypothetical protein
MGGQYRAGPSQAGRSFRINALADLALPIGSAGSEKLAAISLS